MSSIYLVDWVNSLSSGINHAHFQTYLHNNAINPECIVGCMLNEEIASVYAVNVIPEPNENLDLLVL